MGINTPNILSGIIQATGNTTTQPSAQQSNNAPSQQPTNQATLNQVQQNAVVAAATTPSPPGVRVRIIRYLDDGRQTLGIMDVYDENGNLLYQLGTTELPYRGNENNISCIPPGNYKIEAGTFGENGKYWDSFKVRMENGSSIIKGGDGGTIYKRTGILIHEAYNSAWLLGCIAPNQQFDTKLGLYVKNSYTSENAKYLAGAGKDNPIGGINEGRGSTKKVGAERTTVSTNAAPNDSRIATSRLFNTLTNNGAITGKSNSFKMVIQNAPNVVTQLSTSELNSLASPPLGT
tara:strand:+ start:2972 stop:3841 length:870 start_codon:yes stop_codon:yes gene_type:complete